MAGWRYTFEKLSLSSATTGILVDFVQDCVQCTSIFFCATGGKRRVVGRKEGGGRRKHRRGKWEGGRIVELYPGTNQSSLRRPSHARFYATSFFSRHASLSLNVNAREREIPIHPECTTIPVSPSPWLTDAFNHDSFNHVGSPSSRVFRSEIFYPLTRACFP